MRHGNGRADRRAKSAGGVADSLHEAAFVPRVPHLHGPRRGGKRARLAHAEREANPPQGIKAGRHRGEDGNYGAIGHDGGKDSPRAKAVAEPSAGHLEERVGPDEGAENNPHGGFAEAVFLDDERCGVGEAHAIQIRNEVHQAEEKQHHPTHMASPGLFQLLHFHSSITPRKIKPERFRFDCSRSDIHRALSGSNLFSASGRRARLSGRHALYACEDLGP